MNNTSFGVINLSLSTVRHPWMSWKIINQNAFEMELLSVHIFVALKKFKQQDWRGSLHEKPDSLTSVFRPRPFLKSSIWMLSYFSYFQSTSSRWKLSQCINVVFREHLSLTWEPFPSAPFLLRKPASSRSVSLDVQTACFPLSPGKPHNLKALSQLFHRLLLSRVNSPNPFRFFQ